jgi:hypothetical protein
MHAYEMSMSYKCHVNSTSPVVPHKFSYIVAILIHNHFESPNTSRDIFLSLA